jgi:hypothetical protein
MRFDVDDRWSLQVAKRGGHSWEVVDRQRIRWVKAPQSPRWREVVDRGVVGRHKTLAGALQELEVRRLRASASADSDGVAAFPASSDAFVSKLRTLAADSAALWRRVQAWEDGRRQSEEGRHETDVTNPEPVPVSAGSESAAPSHELPARKTQTANREGGVQCGF